MEDLQFEIKKNLRTDGLRVYSGRIVIDQRMGKGEKVLPMEEITEIKANRSMYDIYFIEKSLHIKAQGKTFVIRRLPKAIAEKAREIVISLIPKDRIEKGFVSTN